MPTEETEKFDHAATKKSGVDRRRFHLKNRLKKASRKAGLPPGTLVHIGEKRTEKVKISVLDYDAEKVVEREDVNAGDCFPFRDSPTVTWLNISGIHDVGVVEEIGKGFDLHPLLLEDIVHAGQRPKMEDYGDYLYFTLKMLSYVETEGRVRSEQISLVLGPHFVLSFQESEGDVFDPVRERIRSAKGRIRKLGSDYLVYALIDAVVDNYFAILEEVGERIEALQEEVLSEPTPATLQTIHLVKKELIFLRKSVWPLREAVYGLQREDSPLITGGVAVYLRDVYDHAVQVIDSVETFREMTSSTLDVYLSSLSNKMNEVMKVLTIIATIFIPLTFLAGVYGMNFEYMPELKWHWGYFAVWGIMIVLSIGMLIFFRKKDWL